MLCLRKDTFLVWQRRRALVHFLVVRTRSLRSGWCREIFVTYLVKMLDPTISRTLNDAIERELQPGEIVSSIESPQPRFVTTASTSTFVFGIPWTLFALFWIAGASRFKVPDFQDGFDFFPLFGIPFVLAGFGMLSSPIWAYRNAFKSVYVITDRRAFTIVGGVRTTIRSFFPDDLDDLHRSQRSDGSGDVLVATTAKRGSNGGSHASFRGFLGVADAKSFEDRLRVLAAIKSKLPRDAG